MHSAEYFYTKRLFNVNHRLLCRKKVCLERLGPKSQPFSDEQHYNYLYYCGYPCYECFEQANNGSFRNQTEGPVSRGLPRRANKEVLPLWDSLEKKSAPRGYPKAVGLIEEAIVKSIKLTSRIRRTASYLSEIASKELESLAQHMPNLSGIDARMLAVPRTVNVLLTSNRAR